jgi:hypothetical protein
MRPFVPLTILAVASSVAACGAASGAPSGLNEIAGVAYAQARDMTADLAYMKAHPVPAKPGMTAGIITSVTWLAGQCPPQVRTAAYLAPARGQDPCVAWAFTIIAASGQTLAVTCGSPGRPCPPLVPQYVMPGDEGEYIYAPSDGRITTPANDAESLECFTPDTYPCPADATVTP